MKGDDPIFVMHQGDGDVAGANGCLSDADGDEIAITADHPCPVAVSFAEDTLPVFQEIIVATRFLSADFLAHEKHRRSGRQQRHRRRAWILHRPGPGLADNRREIDRDD